MRIASRRAIILMFGAVAALLAVMPSRLAARMAPASSSADWSVLLHSAQHQFGAGNYPAAIATLQSVVSRDPSSAEAFYWLGRCYFEIRELDQAIAHAQKAVALQPGNSLYEQWLGRDYAAKADRDKSFLAARKVKRHFQKAVQLDPGNVSARRDLEEFCMQAPWVIGGSDDEALIQVQQIERLDPIAGHLARASFDVEALKRPDLAEKEYRAVLAAKPADPEPYFDVVAFFQRQNRPADMNAALDEVARISPSDPRVMLYRAEAMILTGSNLDRAEEYVKSFLASAPARSEWPSHAGAREWLGRLYELEGRLPQAAEQYRASLQLEPGRKSAQARLARLEKKSR